MTDRDVGEPTGVIGIVGTGRAGSSFAKMLERSGWEVRIIGGRDATRPNLDGLARVVEVVLLAVPDGAIADLAGSFSARVLDGRVVLAHCSGAGGLDLLAPAERRGSIHPLVSLNGNNPEQLLGAWFAVAGDPVVERMADSLDGRTFGVGDRDRPLYHAAAVVASNHLVALMAQVEELSAAIGVPAEAFAELAAGSLAGVGELGAARALTGPVSRGDWDTIAGHVRAIVDHELDGEIDAYRALAVRAAVLAGRDPGSVDEAIGRGASGAALRPRS